MPTKILTNLHNIFAAIWRQRYLIITPIILLPLVSILVSIFSDRQWQTHTTILVQESAKMNPFLEDLSVSTNLENRITTLDTLLHSRHMLINVGKDIGKINADSSNSERDALVKKLSTSLKVKLIGKDLVKITLKSSDVENIESTLRLVRHRFVEKLLAPEKASIEASEEFLTMQLNNKRKELQVSEFKLSTFKKDNSSDLPNLYNANTSRLAELKNVLQKHRTSLSGAEAAKKSIRIRLAQLDPVISKLEESIVNLRGELALLRSRYTDNHSKVQITIRKLTQLEEEREQQSKTSINLDEASLNRLWEVASHIEGVDISKNTNSLLISQLQELQMADGRVQQLKEEIKSIENQITASQSSVANFGEMERTLTELERDLTVKRALYTDLLSRYEKARVTGALGRFEQPERIKIIDEPYRPSQPTNLPLLIFIMSGVIAGIALGIGMALIAELSDSTIRNIEQLESLISAPVLSRIPNLAGAIISSEKPL